MTHVLRIYRRKLPWTQEEQATGIKNGTITGG